MIRAEQRAIAKFNQASAYLDGGVSQQSQNSSASFSSVATGVDSNTGAVQLTSLDGGTGSGKSISNAALVPGSIVTQSINTAMGGILNS